MTAPETYTAEQIDKAIALLKAGLEQVPKYMRAGVLGYVEHGRPTGGFLEALFDGELALALQRADQLNEAVFENWREVRRSYLPRACHGSRDRRVAWIEGRGFEGRRAPPKEETP